MRPGIRSALAALAATTVAAGFGAGTAAAAGEPETTITAAPTGPTASGRVPFSFTSEPPGATFECRVDDAPWRACTSPYTTDPQTQGAHTFRVRAIDSGSNADPTPAEATFLVDKSIAGANASGRRSQRQSGTTIIARITVTAAEQVTVTGQGSAGVGKGRVSLVAAGPVIVPAGGSATIALSPRSSRDARRIRKQIKRKGRSQAKLTATFTDALGNTATTGDIPVRLKGD